MTNKEAIEILRANYPDACFGQLREAVDAAIEALKAQNVAGDTISRQAAIEALDKRFDSIPMEQTTEILLLRKDLRELPPAEPKRIRGRWTCDQCGYMNNIEGMNFCQKCGRKM